MDGIKDAIQKLHVQISAIDEVLSGLKEELAAREAERNSFAAELQIRGATYETGMERQGMVQFAQEPLLNAEEYKRYGRQMIMPEVGIDGQLRLKNSSVLIVGVGGLGCPAAAYLAGAGVGKIGLVDGDVVEMSNLHRQILHSMETIGLLKVESARNRLRKMNPKVQYIAHDCPLMPGHAIDVFREYDLILDCTDHPKSRYLVSDAAVLASRPLVSASALKTEGQLLVLNNPPSNRYLPSAAGHCYRCVFPKPPPAESVTSCGEGGILGPVVGVMGVLMAAEALKLLLPSPDNQSASSQNPPAKPTMLLYSAFSDLPFRIIRLGGRRKDCASCSGESTITTESLKSGSLDYTAFCGVSLPQTIIPDNERISAREYKEVRSASTKPHVLVDVREKTHFDLAHLKGSINMPFSALRHDPLKCLEDIFSTIDATPMIDDCAPVYLICRFGNDSQLAMQYFRDAAAGLPARPANHHEIVADVRGGLHAWRNEVDEGFPDY